MFLTDSQLGLLTGHIIQGKLDNVSDPEGSRKPQAALADGHYHAFAELGQYLLLLRHSARSRGIQEPRAHSVLQAFLDAATARSMTWWFAQHGRGCVRYGKASARSMTWWFAQHGRGCVRYGKASARSVTSRY